MTLTSFLYPQGPTRSAFSVFLPGNVRRELAVKSRVTGRWTLLGCALDQVNQVRILEGQLTVIARVSRCFHVTQRRYLNGCELGLARLSKDGRGAARGRQPEASRPRVPKSCRCFVSGSEAPRSPVTRWENTAPGLRSRDRG